MLPLIIAILLLYVGPVLGAAVQRRPRLLHALDGFVLVAIGGLCLLHLLPEAFTVLGFPALLLVAGGAILPHMAESGLAGRLTGGGRGRGHAHDHEHAPDHEQARDSGSAAGAEEGLPAVSPGPDHSPHDHHAHRSDRTWQLALGLSLLGLAVHAALDGVGLRLGETDSRWILPIVMHRLPMSLFLWWVVGRNAGKGAALGVITGLAVATLAGFLLARAIGDLHGTLFLPAIEALLAGSLLHILLHEPIQASRATDRTVSAGVGALAAAILLALSSGGGHVHDHADHGPKDKPAVTKPADPESHAGHSDHGDHGDHGDQGGDDSHGEPHRHSDHGAHGTTGEAERSGGVAGRRLVAVAKSLWLAAAPALLLGFLGAGLLTALVPGRLIAKGLSGRTSFGSAVRGVLVGLPLPICSCGVVPVYRSLIARGAAPAAALAFLIATPEIGIEAAFLSFPLLGSHLAVTRLVVAAIVALAVGSIVGARIPRLESTESPELPSLPEGESRFLAAMRFGFVELVDDIGPWIAVGILAAALVDPLLDTARLQAIPADLQVVALTLMSIPGYVCATAATPVAAVFLGKGVAPGAVLAFLIAGPATNLTTFGVLGELHGRRRAGEALGAIVFACIGLGVAVNHLPLTIEVGDIAAGAGESPLTLFCAGVLAGVFLLSFFRLGPRGVLAALGLGHDHSADECAETSAAGCCGPADAPAGSCCGPAAPATDPCAGDEPARTPERTPELTPELTPSVASGGDSGESKSPCCGS